MTTVLDKIEIIEYEDKYESQLKNLFIQLQKYYVDLDDDKIRVLSDQYIEEYFDFVRYTVLNSHDGKMLISVKNGKVFRCYYWYSRGEYKRWPAENYLP